MCTHMYVRSSEVHCARKRHAQPYTHQFTMFIDLELSDTLCFSRESHLCVCRLQRSLSMAQMSTPQTSTCAPHFTGRPCEVRSELHLITLAAQSPTHHLTRRSPMISSSFIIMYTIANFLEQDMRMYVPCWWMRAQALW